MKSTALVSLALVSVLALAGCGGEDDDTEASPSETPTSATDSGSSSPGIITPEDVPESPKFRQNRTQGVIGDVVVDTCATEADDDGNVVADGSATNSAEVARDIVVEVSWTVSTTSDVVAKGIAIIEDMEPGDTEDWELDAPLEDTEGVTCVPSALAGQVRG